MLQSANDASALVFLIMESEQTGEGCREVLRALRSARGAIHETESGAAVPGCYRKIKAGVTTSS